MNDLLRVETNRHLGYRWYSQSEDREFGGAQDPLYSHSSPIWYQHCLLLISLPFLWVPWTPSPGLGCLEVWMLCRKDVSNVFTRSPKKTWETDIPTRGLWAERGSLPRRRTASRRPLRRSDSWTSCEIRGITTSWESHSKDCCWARWRELALVSNEEKWSGCNGECILRK